jgi:hypothetical protein
MLPLTRQKRYNNFNIFFMLERQLILRTLGSRDEMFDVDIAKLPPDVRCYVDLYLPPLCSRYADLALSPDKWFVQLLGKKDKTCPQAKSHGGDLVPFAELTMTKRQHLLTTWPRDLVHAMAYGRPMTPARRRSSNQT